MKVNKVAIRKLSMLGQRGSIFGQALIDLAPDRENLMVVTADLAQLSGITKFKNLYPRQFLNCGIAEQNMIGIASGMAMAGDCVFVTTYSCFVAVRSLEQIRQHLSYLQCNVKVVGSSAGMTSGKFGVAHWATEDLAFMRVLPGMEVYSPADALEAYKVAEYAVSNSKPMYIRVSGATNCPIVYQEDYVFKPGKMVRLREGTKVAVIATGLMVHESLQAAKLLEQEGISCTVYNMHTIKPLDQEELDRIAEQYQVIVTVEEHNVRGGMGSAVAEYLAAKTKRPRQVFLGMQDRFPAAGSQRFVWEQMGITCDQMAQTIKEEFIRIN